MSFIKFAMELIDLFKSERRGQKAREKAARKLKEAEADLGRSDSAQAELDARKAATEQVTWPGEKTP